MVLQMKIMLYRWLATTSWTSLIQVGQGVAGQGTVEKLTPVVNDSMIPMTRSPSYQFWPVSFKPLPVGSSTIKRELARVRQAVTPPLKSPYLHLLDNDLLVIWAQGPRSIGRFHSGRECSPR
jgi:hypothetical protein